MKNLTCNSLVHTRKTKINVSDRLTQTIFSTLDLVWIEKVYPQLEDSHRLSTNISMILF